MKIQVIVGPDRGQSFALDGGGTLNIGRSHTTDTKLTDQAVSRLHCRIEYDGRRATLFNVSSKGTRVNDTPAAQAELRHGDIIRIGDTEMRFALAATAEAETLLQAGGADSLPDATTQP